MAVFRAYAKVLESSDPSMRIYEAGLRTCPGQPGMVLADVLRRSGGAYATTTPLPPPLRDDIREVAELASDVTLLAIAEQTEVPVSLEHLRGLDPQRASSSSLSSTTKETRAHTSAARGIAARPRRRSCPTGRSFPATRSPAVRRAKASSPLICASGQRLSGRYRSAPAATAPAAPWCRPPR